MRDGKIYTTESWQKEQERKEKWRRFFRKFFGLELVVGKSRVAIVFLLPGIVVKLPRRFHPITAFKIWRNREDYKQYGGWQGYARFETYAGLAENWSEFRFYRRTRHPFLWPVWFSAFGLFNLQPLGQVCKDDEDEFCGRMLYFIGGDSAAHDDIHHFSNPRNFCIDEGGKILILDCGSHLTQYVVQKFGERIWREWNQAL